MKQEEREQAIEKVRTENQRTAVRVEQGIAYHETVTVWFTDRKQHQVEVYAISSKQFRDAARKAGVNPMDLVDEKGELRRQKLMESLDFAGALAEAGTHDPTITEKTLTPNEDGKIAGKVFDLMKEPKN
jgi:hypothetical protein